MTQFVLVLAVIGTVFFLVRALQLHSGYRALGQLEAKRIELEEARARAERPGLRMRIQRAVVAYGYDGDLFPFAAAMAFLYLAVAVALTFTPLPVVADYLIAIPVAVAAVWTAARWSVGRKRRRFNVQLTELLEMVASQIQGGTGAQRALAVVVPTMQEPLRGEMSQVLDAQLATKDLVTSLRELAERYPSRAFSMFISTLEIDRGDGGHAIAPALRQASELINRDFELQAEAVAEVAQQRSEFFMILGLLTLISASMIFGGDPSRLKAYTSPMGLILLIGGVLNIGIGVWRLLNTLRKLESGEGK